MPESPDEQAASEAKITTNGQNEQLDSISVSMQIHSKSETS